MLPYVQFKIKNKHGLWNFITFKTNELKYIIFTVTYKIQSSHLNLSKFVALTM